MDIEDCPIGTNAVREGMKSERERVIKNLDNFSRGATILLREHTERVSKKGEDPPDASAFAEMKTCITDNNATSTEYVDDYIFTNPAGAFFQNNNSILAPFTQYIRDAIVSASTTSTATTTNPPSSLNHLIDAYCGSGLFTITLSPLFSSSIGIDISPSSIAFAQKNATLNNTKNTRFIAATASELFKEIDTEVVRPEQTVVVMDPPRKGCDEGVLELLVGFGHALVV